MKEIKLTHGKVALVDDEDFEYLSGWNWHADKHRNTYYAKTTVFNNGKGIKVRMHRLILGIKDPKVIVDHRDKNGLNNQRANLRQATASENMSNRQSKINSSSIYLGVSFDKKTGKWMARVAKEKVSFYLGCFKTEVEAAKAYNLKAAEVHGTFANLNNIH